MMQPENCVNSQSHGEKAGGGWGIVLNVGPWMTACEGGIVQDPAHHHHQGGGDAPVQDLGIDVGPAQNLESEGVPALDLVEEVKSARVLVLGTWIEEETIGGMGVVVGMKIVRMTGRVVATSCLSCLALSSL
jgi:hypothetical protein